MTATAASGHERWADELSQVAVVMPSCDRYGSLWPLSLEALERYWPDKPAATYLCANHRAYQRPGMQQLLVGDDVSWSDNLQEALQLIPHDYIFLVLDDLVMLPGTRGHDLNNVLARAVREGWNYLRVNPLPAPRNSDAQGLGLAMPGEAYRSSVVWSLWKKAVLQAELRPGESAWAFEKVGSARTDGYTHWWASAVRHVSYLNVITAGSADPAALDQLSGLGFDISGLEFPPMSRQEQRRWKRRLLRSQALKLVPIGLRRTVIDILSKP